MQKIIFNRYFCQLYSKLRAVQPRLLAGALAVSFFLAQGFPCLAEDEIEQRIAAHQAIPVESNQVENWPEGPIVSAESAILIEAGTGVILYEKNIHEKQYPASTTKILTTLIASEQCSLDEVVEFSHEAVFSVPRDSNHIAMDEGQALSMEDCLNAILIRSANEVSNAVAEHIAGNVEEFAKMMNTRAAELGCIESNFVNPNGLPDENHYTSAYDLAQIGRAFFANEMLCKISTTSRMHILPTERQPREKIENSSNQLLPNGNYAYEYLVGTKTGYTTTARSCLVTSAEKNGMKLICVVLNDESPLQYEDTIALFEYGFNNFDKINISQTETKYNIDNEGLFYSGNDIFGSSQPLLSLNKESYILLPKTTDFGDITSSISYETQNEGEAATISYSYHNVFIGSATLDLAAPKETYRFESVSSNKQNKEENSPSFIFINILKVILIVAGIAVLGFALFLLRAFLKNRQLIGRGSRSRRKFLKKRRRYGHPSYPTPHTSLQELRKEQIRQTKRRRKPKRSSKFRDF